MVDRGEAGPQGLIHGPSVDSIQPAPVAVPTRVLLEGGDSITTTPGRSYPAGRIKRMFAGDLNRHLWSVPVTFPVLDLDRVGGGLAPKETIGGKQTVGLRFIARDGLEYEFRPLVKHGDPGFPKWLPGSLPCRSSTTRWRRGSRWAES